VGGVEDRPAYDYADGVTLRVYELSDGHQSTTVIPTSAGAIAATIEIRREGQTISVATQGDLAHWRLLLVGLTSSAGVEGGSAEQAAEGIQVVPADGKERLTIHLTA
jgi:alpha-D-xyloside xylohydrolase